MLLSILLLLSEYCAIVKLNYYIITISQRLLLLQAVSLSTVAMYEESIIVKGTETHSTTNVKIVSMFFR